MYYVTFSLQLVLNCHNYYCGPGRESWKTIGKQKGKTKYFSEAMVFCVENLLNKTNAIAMWLEYVISVGVVILF